MSILWSARPWSSEFPDMKMGEVGCACIVPAGDLLPDPKELIELCASRLARFKVPRHVVFLTAEELPLTATGRAQKFKLAELAKERLFHRRRRAGRPKQLRTARAGAFLTRSPMPW